MKYLFAYPLSVLYAICGVLLELICYVLCNIFSFMWTFKFVFNNSFGFKIVFRRYYNDMLKFLW